MNSEVMEISAVMRGSIRLLTAIFFALLLSMCSGEEIPDPLELELITTDVTEFEGSDGSISLGVHGGVAPYTFSWSNGATTKDIEGLSAGIYSVTVRDAADSVATATDTVNEPIPENILFDIQGNKYTTVVIGDQTWMQQNLRVTVTPDSTPVISYVYGGNEALAATYGRLYSWDVAMNGSTQEKAQGLCPTGWHIPSDEEWKILEINLGMTRAEADLTNIWRGDGVGTKLGKGGESGYEALYAGRRTSGGSYSLFDWYEYVWTSTEYGSNAWRRCLDKNQTTVGRWNTFPKTYGFSVRCIKNQQ
jgi:uncharacterized protein (TIGR02145 family)